MAPKLDADDVTELLKSIDIAAEEGMDDCDWLVVGGWKSRTLDAVGFMEVVDDEVVGGSGDSDSSSNNIDSDMKARSCSDAAIVPVLVTLVADTCREMVPAMTSSSSSKQESRRGVSGVAKSLKAELRMGLVSTVLGRERTLDGTGSIERRLAGEGRPEVTVFGLPRRSEPAPSE